MASLPDLQMHNWRRFAPTRMLPISSRIALYPSVPYLRQARREQAAKRTEAPTRKAAAKASPARQSLLQPNQFLLTRLLLNLLPKNRPGALGKPEKLPAREVFDPTLGGLVAPDAEEDR